jgi:hypothetical protein
MQWGHRVLRCSTPLTLFRSSDILGSAGRTLSRVTLTTRAYNRSDVDHRGCLQHSPTNKISLPRAQSHARSSSVPRPEASSSVYCGAACSSTSSGTNSSSGKSFIFSSTANFPVGSLGNGIHRVSLKAPVGEKWSIPAWTNGSDGHSGGQRCGDEG